MASQSIVPVISGNPIKNGSVVVFTQETGGYQTLAPEINHYESSGNLSSKLVNRFDEHYMGGTASSGCC